jgi:hypothetical protein
MTQPPTRHLRGAMLGVGAIERETRQAFVVDAGD